MAERPEKLLLLDTASLYFRAYFGVPESMKAPDGTPVNAVRGLLDMIARLVTDLRPTRLVMLLGRRLAPGVPGRRDPVVQGAPGRGRGARAPRASRRSRTRCRRRCPIIVDVLAALGIARVGVPGYEADDVIGTLVAREVAKPTDRAVVEVVTGDRDLFQLVDDEVPVRVLYTARGIRDLETVDQARLQEKYGVATGSGYADMAVLRGDPSDGLPGRAGDRREDRGRARAPVRVAGRDPGGARRRGRGAEPDAAPAADESAAYLAVAPAVVRVAPDAPVGEVDDRLPAVVADAEAARRARGAVGALVERQARGGRARPRLTPVAGG